MHKLILPVIIVVACCTSIVHAQTIDIYSREKFDVINRHLSIYDSAGKKIAHLDAAEGIGIAWLNNINFSKGTIEFDVKGKDVIQQSFVGIAFHGMNDSTYDAFYFRPFNFQSTDTARKNHSVQYISMPQYDWFVLRKDFPGKYEKSLTTNINANSWFHAKIIVDTDKIEVFVNNDSTPSLIVHPLNNYATGNIGFWAGNNSDGNFAGLSIKTR